MDTSPKHILAFFKKKGLKICSELAILIMRNKDLHIRLTEEEHKKIREIAEIEKTTISYIFINSVLYNKRRTEKKVVFEFINKLSFDYTKIATNVNQIAKFVNSQEYVTEQQAIELKDLILEFNKLKSEQINLLKGLSEIIEKW